VFLKGPSLSKEYNQTLDIVIGDSIDGFDTTLKSIRTLFYFKFGHKSIPSNLYIGYPISTMTLILKATRLIENGKYDEREVFIDGTNISIVFKLQKAKTLIMEFIEGNQRIYVYKDNYLSVLCVFLTTAEKSLELYYKSSKLPITEPDIIKEIRFMKKHLEEVKYR